MNFFSKQTPLKEPVNESLHKPTSDTEPVLDEEKNPFIEIIRFSLIALLIVVPIRMFIAQPFIVSGASMEETFHNGEYLIVDQLSYQFHTPQHGDVVIFRYPRDPSKYFIKRIIGVPGDTIFIEGSTIRLTNSEYPEGYVLDEPYVKAMTPGVTITEELGPREYFVMGDNRDESSDSRVWGVLQEERIIGRAFMRLYPLQNIDYLPGALDEFVIRSPKSP